MDDRENIAFTVLYNSFIRYLESSNIYELSVVKRFRARGVRLKKLMVDQNIAEFNDHNAIRLYDIAKSSKLKYLATAINRLAEFQANGKIIREKQFRSKRKLEISGAFAQEIQSFIIFEKQSLKKSHDIQLFENQLSLFNIYCKENNIFDYSLAVVINYFTNTTFKFKSYPTYALRTLRAFTKFMYEEKKISRDFSKSIPIFREIKQPKVPSVYSEQEIVKILESVNRNSAKGLRDFAMLLLVALTGMRPHDVCMLTFTEVDWGNNIIKFTQGKTDKKNELPLLPAVKQAILDYVKDARPNSSSPNIFLTVTPPHRALDSHSLYGAMTKALSIAGIDVGTRIKGPRAFRSSVATRIQSTGQPIYVVSGILGNIPDTAKNHYIRVFHEALYDSALEVPPVQKIFFTQNTFII